MTPSSSGTTRACDAFAIMAPTSSNLRHRGIVTTFLSYSVVRYDGRAIVLDRPPRLRSGVTEEVVWLHRIPGARTQSGSSVWGIWAGRSLIALLRQASPWPSGPGV